MGARLAQAWLVLRRAATEAHADDVTTTAQALAYSLFLAIPAMLLVSLGVFSLVADEGMVEELVARAGTVMPQEAVTLLEESLSRTSESTRGGILMTVLGLALGLWTTTSAAATLMKGITTAFDREDRRSFVRKRLLALLIVFALVSGSALVLGLLVLGPHLEGWIGDATGAETLVSWAWWTAQWPVLVLGLLFAFSVVLYLGPDVEQPRWRLVTPGAVAALVLWLAGSALFAVYASRFGSYDRTWGTLSAVVITLVWLWLTSVSLLFGAEINAEAQRLAGARAEPDERDERARAGIASAGPDARFPLLVAGNSHVAGTEIERGTVDTDRIAGKKKELEGEGQQSWGKTKDAARDKWEDVKDRAEDVTDGAEDRWDERDEKDEEAATR